MNQFKSSLQGMLGGSLWPCEKFLVTIGPPVQEILIDLGVQPIRLQGQVISSSILRIGIKNCPRLLDSKKGK